MASRVHDTKASVLPVMELRPQAPLACRLLEAGFVLLSLQCMVNPRAWQATVTRMNTFTCPD